MLKQRLAAADAVRAAFLRVENQAADFHEATAQFCATLAIQRREAGLQVATGIDVQALAATACHGAATSYKALIECHPLLVDLITDVGIRRMFGGDDTKPEGFYPEGAEQAPATA